MPILKRTKKPKKVAIVANGIITNLKFLQTQLELCDYIIACDGGLVYFLELDIVPDFIIGDFDSAEDIWLEKYAHVQKRKFPIEKDQTDLELAIFHADAIGASSIILLASLGGRIDHQLANIFIMKIALTQGMQIETVDENTKIKILGENFNSCSISKKDGETVSLLPLTVSATGITAKGLQYPLNNDKLFNCFSKGISNKIIGDFAQITIMDGTLLIVQTQNV
ncbi:MAG: thiamine diphosphokinase [Firmicutes bacterium]|nr:thiamine diphosphokinase [Bacillota bacterium]